MLAPSDISVLSTSGAHCQSSGLFLGKQGQDAGQSAGFYKNRIGEAIVEALQQRGSVMDGEDLAAHRTRFTTPISTTYRGHTIHEIRPPTQVMSAL